MDLKPLPFSATSDAYHRQAEALLDAHRRGDPQAANLFHQKHPRFLDEKIPWLPKTLPEGEIRDAALDLADAQLTIARWYDFKDWSALAAFVNAVIAYGSPVFEFESAIETVIDGDISALTSLLTENPRLVMSCSTRVTHFDPPIHRATLLHYIAANGVESYHQRTPGNAVEIARILLTGGAEVDALAGMYGGQWTTLSLLVSSDPPAEAGVQAALVDTLVDFGASVEPGGAGNWRSPLMTALAFGFRDAAEALVRRGASVIDLASAAELGRLTESSQLLPASDPGSRHRALALAAQLGHTEVVRLLLDAGEDSNRYNPENTHSHSTPLHQAAFAGHESVVRLLVERGARLDIKDTIYQSTPLGWAEYGGQNAIAKYLRERPT